MRLVRAILVLDVVAAAAVALGVLLGLGAPLAARGALGPRALLAVALASATLGVAVGGALLLRSVGRPVERLLSAAERLRGRDGALPILDPPGERPIPSLGRAALAFERAAAALEEERARLAAKVEELSRANRELADAREASLRSERLAVVGRLASGVAHEVGNPLGAVAGYADLALARLRAGAPGEAADLVGRIGDEAARIDRIVRDLLDFARPAPLALAPVAVADVVELAARLARMQPRFKGVVVERELPPDLPPIRADEGRLAQVLLNLLLNAGDAMAGAGAVRIAARADGEEVELAVADGGPGIPEGDLPRVFDPFFTTKPPGSGTGLGLSVSHGIVESLGGTIAAANAPGGGAVFRVRLPVARPERAGAGGPARR
jgi:signal transduction histidine kinase